MGKSKYKLKLIQGSSYCPRDVAVIDSNDPDSFQKVCELRIDGIPCILINAHGWSNFASSWIKEGSYPPELCVTKFCEALGNAQVPVLEKGYNSDNPLSRMTELCDFVNYVWNMDCPDLYLHQWQFPTSATHMNLTSEPGAHTPSPALGIDLMEHIHEKSGSNPLQYLFMGAASTKTHLHVDDGGLAITIAPIVGLKECWLVHRDDGCKFERNDIDPENPDLEAYPQFASARVWHTILQPGQVLVMPHSTWHACRNVTACLSYTRLHLDLINLQAYGSALLKGESPDAVDKHFVWNSAQWLISEVDKITRRGSKEATKRMKYLKEIRSNNMEATRKIIDAGNVVEKDDSFSPIKNTDRTAITASDFGLSAPSREDLLCFESLASMRHVIRHIDMCTEDITKCVKSSQWGVQWMKILADIDQSLDNFSKRYIQRKRKITKQ